MATTLFDLEGKVTINAADFFTTATSVGTQLDSLATAVSKLETTVSGLRISNILDSTTFTAEQIIVTEGLDALASKVSGLKDTLSTIDLGGTLLSTLGAGLASLAGNLLVGDIKVGLDTPTEEEISAEITGITTYIESLGGATISVTLPDASVDPLSTEITTAGSSIATALETAAEWEFPVPNMPSIASTQAKIKAFWSIVTSGLNLSVDAFINVHTNQVGGAVFNDWNTSQTSSQGTVYANSNSFWNPESEYAITLTQEVIDRASLFKPDWESLQDAIDIGFFGPEANGNPYIPYDDYPALLHRGERVLTRQQNEDYTANQNKTDASDMLLVMEQAFFSALSRWASPVGGDALAAIMTPRVDEGLAYNTRGVR